MKNEYEIYQIGQIRYHADYRYKYDVYVKPVDLNNRYNLKNKKIIKSLTYIQI